MRKIRRDASQVVAGRLERVDELHGDRVMQARNEHDGYIGAALRGRHRLRHFCRRLEIGKDEVDIAIDELLNRDLQVLIEGRPDHNLALDEFCVSISELNHFFLEPIIRFFDLWYSDYRNLFWHRGDL